MLSQVSEVIWLSCFCVVFHTFCADFSLTLCFVICSNASLGLCLCEKDDWKAIHKGLWFSVMSPYEDRYVDVKFLGDVSGSLTITIEEG